MNICKDLTDTVKKSVVGTFGSHEPSESAKSFPEVKISDRPDLADYQWNGAMELAKRLKQKPRDLAQALMPSLQEALKDEAEISIAGPGFINFKLSDALLVRSAESMMHDPKMGFRKTTPTRRVVIDFGGPNIAKELHVGHTRPHVIGDALQHLMRFCGDEVTSDIHFGDWGTPIGMIISQLKREQPDLGFFSEEGKASEGFALTIEELGKLYKRSKASWDESDAFKDEARQATEALQSGRNRGYRALWKHLREISVGDVAKLYDRLNIKFDLWLGESDVNDMLPAMLDELVQKGFAKESQGAIVIPAEILEMEGPPLILQRSDKAYSYAATDLATIKYRVDSLKADTIIYVVDHRQSDHFKQVFAAAKKVGYAKEDTILLHAGNGTINGPDGKPYKTRSGEAVQLKSILDYAEEKARAEMPKPGEDGISEEEIATLSNQIGMGAIKVQELSNARMTDYVFDINNFTSFNGNTGPFLQYNAVRCNALLKKAAKENVKPGTLKITSKAERDILIQAISFPDAVTLAYERKEPNHIVSQAFALTRAFSSFYTASPILGETDAEIKASRLCYVELVSKQLDTIFGILNVERPERMLKAERSKNRNVRERDADQLTL